MRWWVLLLTAAPLLASGGKLSALISAEDRAFVVAVRDAGAGRELAAGGGLAVVEHPDLLPGHLVAVGPVESAASLAASDAVEYVFPAAPELLNGERVAACAGALVADADVATYSKFGQGWRQGPSGAEVGYILLNSVERVPFDLATAEVMRAIGEWSRHANLRFTPSSDPTGRQTIAIRFARAAHGDSYPFDGPGRILAHTFYPAPPNPEPIAGDIHLDADEGWAIGEATDLFTVVLHEMGHAVGLGHSDRPGAVMYPYYRIATGLSSDDIEGLQSLYGAKNGTPPNGPAPLRLTIAAPSGPLTTGAETVSVQGRAEGGKAPVQVRWESDRGPAGPAAGGAEWRIDAVPLSFGLNRIGVTAIDADGANATQTVSVTRSAPVLPPQPPPASQPLTLKITYPGLTIIGISAPSITIRGQASGAVKVTWSSSAGLSGDASGTATWSADIPLYFGTNTLTVRANSAAGAQVWRSLTIVRR